MNKWLLLLAGSVMGMNAQAESWCGYKDYFHISNPAHPDTYIVSGYADPDLFLQFVGPRNFIIKDTYQCRMGYAHVTVAYSAANWCVLTVKDGPYNFHPTISATCNGMRYIGMKYDGFGSYSYAIEVE